MKRLALVLALLGGPAVATSPVMAAEITVDVGAPFKPVDHAASGSLYGIAAEGWPADKWIAAIHPKNFTEMAPGGAQLPNGEKTPVGDALIVAPIAARAGATVTIRMPDIFPSFPYVWEGDENWSRSVDAIVHATVAADPPNIYAYEIWNEPDWNWKSGWGDFDEMWARTNKAIRAIDAKRRIMGPSASRWDANWMRGFLVDAKASGTVPDIVSWHELDPSAANDLATHVAAYRALEKELGIGPLPISINEYGPPRDAAVPGTLTRFVARLERAGVDTADLAFWHKPGRLADLVAPVEGGRGPAMEAEPTGAFWVYKWYGEMTGQMVSVTPADGTGERLDAFASYNPDDGIVRIVLGGEDGDHRVTVTGLGDFGATAEVEVYATRWTGTDGGLPAPVALFRRTMPVTDAAITVPIDGASYRDAFLVLVTREGKAPRWTEPMPHWTMRLEAEDAARKGARVFPVRMSPGDFFANAVSGNGYVGLLDRKDVAVSFSVNVPAAGTYDLAFGYSNGLAETAMYFVAVNDAPPLPIRFTPTQFRELIDQSALQIKLPAGASTITLSAGPNSPKGNLLPSLIEIDYLDVTAVD
jgi:hypothetical protein